MEVRLVVPTEQMVCEALYEWYRSKVKYDKEAESFMFQSNKVWRPLEYITNLWEMPPNLIVMIGLFYQYGVKNEL